MAWPASYLTFLSYGRLILVVQMGTLPEGNDDEDESKLDLSSMFQARISKKAEKLIAERARQAGMKSSTWGRRELYKALGLLDEGTKS